MCEERSSSATKMLSCGERGGEDETRSTPSHAAAFVRARTSLFCVSSGEWGLERFLWAQAVNSRGCAFVVLVSVLENSARALADITPGPLSDTAPAPLKAHLA